MKKINFGDILDYLGKNISRLKTIGKVLAVVVFITSLGGNGCQRNTVIELAGKVTGLDIKNSILKGNIVKKDHELAKNKIERDSLKAVITGLNDKAKILEDTETILRADLREIKDSLINVPTDSSYAYLQAVAYPFSGEFKYPFNEPQVRNIHLDFLENKDLWILNENLMNQVDNCKLTISVKDQEMVKYGEQAINLMSQTGDYEEMMENEKSKNELLQNDIKKEKRKKGVWKVLTGIATGIAIVFAL